MNGPIWPANVTKTGTINRTALFSCLLGGKTGVPGELKAAFSAVYGYAFEAADVEHHREGVSIGWIVTMTRTLGLIRVT